MYSYKEYKKYFLDSTIREMIVLDLHMSLLEFDCQDEIKRAIAVFKNSSNYDIVLNYIGKRTETIEKSPEIFSEDSDYFIKRFGQNILFATILSKQLKETELLNHRLFNSRVKISPEKFFSYFRNLYIDVVFNFIDSIFEYKIEEQIKGSENNVVFKYCDDLRKICYQLRIRAEKWKKTSLADYEEELFNYLWAIISLQETYLDLYMDQEGMEQDANTEKTIAFTERELTEYEIFKMVDFIVESTTKLLSIYVHIIKKLEEKFSRRIGEVFYKTDFMDIILEGHQDMINELSICGERWVYDSFCSFLSN